MTTLHPTEPIATFEHSLPQEQVDLFFEAVGWRLPTRPPSHPTLATLFRHGEIQALQKFNISLQKVLHGEQRYHFHAELLADTPYKGETFLTNHYKKSGGAGEMNFYVLQTKLNDMSGHTCVECFTTIIVRG